MSSLAAGPRLLRLRKRIGPLVRMSLEETPSFAFFFLAAVPEEFLCEHSVGRSLQPEPSSVWV
jgi:hypothetical protein